MTCLGVDIVASLELLDLMKALSAEPCTLE